MRSLPLATGDATSVTIANVPARTTTLALLTRHTARAVSTAATITATTMAIAATGINGMRQRMGIVFAIPMRRASLLLLALLRSVFRIGARASGYLALHHNGCM